MIQLGYCCINNTLSQVGILTGRTVRKATFEQQGLPLVSQLALQNCKDLYKILEWNANNNIWVFRVGSNFFPWNSEYQLTDLPDYEAIAEALRAAGKFALQNNMRLTAHPDHFVKLASENPLVVQNSIHDLEHHNEVFRLMGLPATKKFCLNIHVGMNRSAETSTRFLYTLERLSDETRNRLVVENDDKPNGYSVKDLYGFLPLDIPITFDYFHHSFHTSGISERDAVWIAASTWYNTGRITPLFHYSESKNLNESLNGNPRAHADYVYTQINPHDIPMDIDLEAKAKEHALLLYRQTHPSIDTFSIPHHDFSK